MSLLLICLCNINEVANASNISHSIPLKSEEYLVINIAMNTFVEHFILNVNAILINSETDNRYSSLHQYNHEFNLFKNKKLLDSLMFRHEKDNMPKYAVNSNSIAFINKIKVYPFSWDSSDLYNSKYCSQFDKNLAFITFSKPVFDKTMNFSLLYVSYIVGSLNGAGFFLLLEKTQNSWRVISKNYVWVS